MCVVCVLLSVLIGSFSFNRTLNMSGTDLRYAAKKGNVSSLRRLLDAKVNVDAKDPRDYSSNFAEYVSIASV